MDGRAGSARDRDRYPGHRVHLAGLVWLTYTPSPTAFLNDVLGRPSSERPSLVLVVGYPAVAARVPALTRQSLADIATLL